MNLGSYIFNDILENKYLNFLYDKLNRAYFYRIIGSELFSPVSEKDKVDLLRFSDILSKSTSESKRDHHNNIAQSIISMLNILFPEDNYVKYVSGSVLSHVNNYLGLDKNFCDYCNMDFIEFIKEFNKREEYYIPNSGDDYFINTQKLAFERIKQNDYYSFSAPTSMGKTFLIKTYIKQCIINNENKNFAIVVPSKALINEISNSILDSFGKDLSSKNYRVIHTPNAIVKEETCNYIMIFTQERLLQLLLQHKQVKLSHVFIDEAHKLSDIDNRNPFFYKIIEILQKEHFEVKIDFSCPNIPNPEIYLGIIKGLGNKAYNCFRYSPVNQIKTIIDIQEKKQYIYNDLSKSYICLNGAIDEVGNFIQLVDKIGKNKSNIIFCNSRNDAVNWAIEYSQLCQNDCSDNQEIITLIQDIKEEIHEDCFLTKTLLKGTAYHVAYLPARIKEKIEELCRKKVISTVFCTSTLLEGVNFPADNLFIKLSSRDSWLKKRNRTNFKNLLGRVGRIDFNLFGNVFCVSDDACKEYMDAISEEIDEQKLSIDNMTDSRKRDIIQTLLLGKTVLEKRSVDTFESLSFARKTLNILLNEIVNNLPGIISNSFSKYLDSETIDKIKNNFKNRENKVPQDLLATNDEIEKLDYAIKICGLKYPEQINFENVNRFLNDISTIFNWEKFESKLDVGSRNRLRYYATLILKWVFGYSIKEIINSSVEYCKNNGVYYHFESPHNRPFDGSPEQINKIINDVLDEIDNILQFKIPNYFLKFSERFKEINSVDFIENDWYEYMEYGSTNFIVIKCQQMGISREGALYIYKNNYFSIESSRLFIKTDFLTDSKYDEEIRRFKINYPEFVYKQNQIKQQN